MRASSPQATRCPLGHERSEREAVPGSVSVPLSRWLLAAVRSRHHETREGCARGLRERCKRSHRRLSYGCLYSRMTHARSAS